MRAPVVQFVDSALPAKLFARLRRAVEALGEQRLRHTYQTTFWFDFRAEPSNVVEEAIAALPRVGVGAEWWLSRMRTSNVQVDFHRDRDEALALKTGRQVHPLKGSVLFLNRCRGGLLAVSPQAPNPKNGAFVPDRPDFDFVQPRPNRYAWFRGQQTHGVLDAENQVPGRRLPREPGLRLTIAINFWKTRPTALESYDQRRVYRSLTSF